jgi:hypothetical protein
VTHRYEDLLRVFAPQPWMVDAACRGAQCAEAGRTEVHGIWGGQAPRDRRPRSIAHGRVSGYNVGCRCEPCVEIKRETNAARSRAKDAA